MNPEYIVAHHEASHAVASCLMHKPFKNVTIIPDKDTLGALTHYKVWVNPEIENRSLAISTVKAYIFICLAGPVSEDILKVKKPKSKKTIYYKCDWTDVVNMAVEICGNMEQTQALVDFMYIQTKGIIKVSWKAVRLVAKNLLEHKTLSYRKTRQLMKEAFDCGIIPDIHLL